MTPPIPHAVWVRALSSHDCPPGEVRELIIDQHIVAVANVAGQFYAVHGICLHQGGPLGRGVLVGCQLGCPWHGWQYDVRDGKHASQAVCLDSYPIEIRDDDIWIALPPREGDDVARTEKT